MTSRTDSLGYALQTERFKPKVNLGVHQGPWMNQQHFHRLPPENSVTDSACHCCITIAGFSSEFKGAIGHSKPEGDMGGRPPVPLNLAPQHHLRDLSRKLSDCCRARNVLGPCCSVSTAEPLGTHHRSQEQARLPRLCLPYRLSERHSQPVLHLWHWLCPVYFEYTAGWYLGSATSMCQLLDRLHP